MNPNLFATRKLLDGSMPVYDSALIRPIIRASLATNADPGVMAIATFNTLAPKYTKEWGLPELFKDLFEGVEHFGKHYGLLCDCLIRHGMGLKGMKVVIRNRTDLIGIIDYHIPFMDRYLTYVNRGTSPTANARFMATYQGLEGRRLSIGPSFGEGHVMDIDLYLELVLGTPGTTPKDMSIAERLFGEGVPFHSWTIYRVIRSNPEEAPEQARHHFQFALTAELTSDCPRIKKALSIDTVYREMVLGNAWESLVRACHRKMTLPIDPEILSDILTHAKSQPKTVMDLETMYHYGLPSPAEVCFKSATDYGLFLANLNVMDDGYRNWIIPIQAKEEYDFADLDWERGLVLVMGLLSMGDQIKAMLPRLHLQGEFWAGRL